MPYFSWFGKQRTFDTNTWRSVYNRIVASAQFDGEKKYTEEKSKHDKTKEELQQARDTIESKTENEKKLNDTILKQQEEFCSRIARFWAILIYAVPYISLSLVIIFVQSLFVNWTVKGICFGVLTVIVGILLPKFFSKLKETIQSRILKKWQKKLNGNKWILKLQ